MPDGRDVLKCRFYIVELDEMWPKHMKILRLSFEGVCGIKP